jgi:hypothetical protein
MTRFLAGEGTSQKPIIVNFKEILGRIKKQGFLPREAL